MKAYTLTLLFDNLDNFLGTDYQATAQFEIQSDNYSHAMMLAQKFCKVMEADRFDLDEK
jgi:hypothetical protein